MIICITNTRIKLGSKTSTVGLLHAPGNTHHAWYGYCKERW